MTVRSAPATIPRLVTRAADRFGSAPFARDAVTTRTFADLAERTACVAARLRAGGVHAGDRVLIVAGNGIATIEAWLGAIHAGAIPVPCNPASTEAELRFFGAEFAPRAVLFDAAASAVTRAAAAGADVLYAALDDLADGSATIPPHDAAAADTAAIVATSGTTSRPKGAQVRHLAYVGAGESMRAWLGLSERERLWSILPFFHINAQAYSLMTALANGYELVVTDRFHASTFWRDAASLGVTAVNLIGAMLAILERQAPDAFVPGALRLLYCAPALEPHRNRALETRFDARIVTGFGMSENVFGCIESATSRDKPGAIGRLRTHPDGSIPNELRIVTPDGREAVPGETGELWFRNAAVTPGYWKAPEITAGALAGGWLHTGDAGYVDDDGDVILTGRYKEMIRRRGENIAPREVEEVIAEHPGVEAVAVIGVPSELSEEDVVACVIRATGGTVDEAALRVWCGTRLAPHKVPLRVVFRDAFPLTPTLRVAKDRLRADVLAGKG